MCLREKIGLVASTEIRACVFSNWSRSRLYIPYHSGQIFSWRSTYDITSVFANTDASAMQSSDKLYFIRRTLEMTSFEYSATIGGNSKGQKTSKACRFSYRP